MKRAEATRRGASVWLVIGLLSAFTLWVSGGAMALHQAVAHASHEVHVSEGRGLGLHSHDGDHGHSQADCATCHLLVHAAGLAGPTAVAVHHEMGSIDRVGPVADRLPDTHWSTSASPRGPPAHL